MKSSNKHKVINYKIFDQLSESPEPIFHLFENVYGDSSAIRRRWDWEIMSHPVSNKICIVIAEHNDRLIGMTVRMPYTLIVNGDSQEAFFASNSMIAPDFRGQGVIGNLYDIAAAVSGDVQFSKGTAAAMHAVLHKKGYQDVVPSSYQVCILTPLRWLLGKIAKRVIFQPKIGRPCLNNFGFQQIQQFPEYYDDFVRNALSRLGGGLFKSSAYMNWRYFQNPYRQYQVFLSYQVDVITSMLVLRVEGMTAYLVDILWDGAVPTEPSRTLKFAKYTAKRMGARKLVAWGAHVKFRDACRRNFFFRSKESPSFSWFLNQSGTSTINMGNVHIVHGDGDIEYL